MFTLMTQIMAQNGHIQAFTLFTKLSEIEQAFSRMEGMYQQLRVINPGNTNQEYAWAMLDQQARMELNQLRLAHLNTDIAAIEFTLKAFQEKVEYAVALL